MASPRPEPRRGTGRLSAPEALEHPLAGLGAEPLSCVLDRHGHVGGRELTTTAIDPSEGVCPSAFVSRL